MAAPSPQKPSPSGSSDGRSALLDAIRGAGGVSSLKSTPRELRNDRSTPFSSPSSAAGAAAGAGAAEAASGGGNDLTMSLIAALQDRKKAIQSDDSDTSSDESDWDD